MDRAPYEAFRKIAAEIVNSGTVQSFIFLAATSQEQYRRCVRYATEENLLRNGYGPRMLAPSGPLNRLIISRTCYCGRIAWNIRTSCECWIYGHTSRRIPRALTKRNMNNWNLDDRQEIFPAVIQCLICNITESSNWYVDKEFIEVSTDWIGRELVCAACCNKDGVEVRPMTYGVLDELIDDWWYMESFVSDVYCYGEQLGYLDMNKFGHLHAVFSNLIKATTARRLDFITLFDPDSPLITLAAQLKK